MRVVHLSCIAPPEVGGMGKAALREVVGLRARGIDARLVTSTYHESSVTQQEDTDRSFITRLKPLMRWGNGAIIPQIADEFKGADLIHLHYPFYGTAEFIGLGLIKLPCPLVITFHMDAAPKGVRALLVGLQRLFLQSLILRRAQKIILSSFDYAHSSSARKILTQHPERLTELPFGIDTDFFSPGPSHRERFFLPPDAPTVLFVGGLDQAHAFKGIHELLQAFALLGPAPHLLIVGDGDLRASFEAEARTLNIDPRVHFLGRLDDITLRDAFRSADVFALPSTSQAEAFGLVAVEAAACGLPVIASELPGVRTVVRQNETGLLVPPKNIDALMAALKQLLTNAPLRHEFGQRGRTHVEQNFSWDRHLDGLMQVYQEVTNHV